MLPTAFLSRMNYLLGDVEYERFFTALCEEENVHAIRYNTKKIDEASVLASFGDRLRKISYAEDGFFCDVSHIGHHPLHHAGAIYSQDPGAMAPINCLDVERGWCVADFCASPGGKSTQLSAMIGETGILLSNEINPTRCKVLVGNIERLGVENSIVTNVDSDQLAAWFDSCFDLVLVDAPCSGEGMFRKYDYAKDEWTPEAVIACAERQRLILANAARTVKAGGYLLYSTCTFSLEENEMNVDDFLEAHPDFSVCEVKDAVKAVTAPGVPFEGAKHPDDLSKARRFYPHLHAGEGQFMCLLKKAGETDAPGFLYKEAKTMVPSQDELALTEDFLKNTLVASYRELLPGFVIKKIRDMMCLVPEGFPVPPHHCYMAGCAIGTVQKGRIEPHHHYFSAMGKHFLRKVSLTEENAEVARYLRGETFETDLPNGYAVVTVRGAAIGGVKIVNGVAKNHYPKGLRVP